MEQHVDGVSVPLVRCNHDGGQALGCHLVQRGVGLEELAHHLRVAVHGREHEGAAALLVDLVHGGAGLEEHVHGLVVALLPCEPEGTRAVVCHQVDVGLGLHKHLHQRGVAALNSEHERAPALAVLVVNRGLGLQELLHDGYSAPVHREHERRAAIVLGLVHVGLGPDEHLRHGSLAVLGGHHQRRAPVWPRLVHVGASLQQLANGPYLAKLHREDERGNAVRPLPVHSGARTDEQPHDLRPPVLGGVHEHRGALGLRRLHAGLRLQELAYDCRTALRHGQVERGDLVGPLLVDVGVGLQELGDLLAAAVPRGQHQRGPALALGALPGLAHLLHVLLGLHQALAHLAICRLELQRPRQVSGSLLQRASAGDAEVGDAAAVECLAVVGVQLQRLAGVGDAASPVLLLQARLRGVQVQREAECLDALPEGLGDLLLQRRAGAVDDHVGRVLAPDLAAALLLVEPHPVARALLHADAGAGLLLAQDLRGDARRVVDEARVRARHAPPVVVARDDPLDEFQALRVLDASGLDIPLLQVGISGILLLLGQVDALLCRRQLPGSLRWGLAGSAEQLLW
mmetsp:Transcript_35702/g.96890  ORF Transcript_35702/g.96890 Transcript_35702/m.96890 type:complete len:572 (+) Transcript_35702:209-1924(+)